VAEIERPDHFWCSNLLLFLQYFYLNIKK